MDNEIERKVVLHAGVAKDEIFHVFESKSNSQNKKTGSEGHALSFIGPDNTCLEWRHCSAKKNIRN